MKHTRLMDVLKRSGLELHKSRLEFLSLMIVALVQAKTVNLAELVGMNDRHQPPGAVMESRAQGASLYRRAQRFLRELKLPEAFYVRYALQLHPKESYSLCLDRTNWKFGKLKINVLMLAYAHEGIAIPLLWCLLPKFGNSATAERIDLMDRLLTLLLQAHLDVLLADREFVGRDWFSYLEQQGLPFVIRVRKDALGDGWFPLFRFFQALPVGQHKVLKQRYRIFGCELAVAGARLAGGEYIIVVTNRNPRTALSSYAKRWQIECLLALTKVLWSRAWTCKSGG